MMFSKKDFKEDIEALSAILYISTILNLILFLMAYFDTGGSEIIYILLFPVWFVFLIYLHIGTALPWLFVGLTALALASAGVRFPERKENPKIFYIRCGCVVCNLIFIYCASTNINFSYY